MKRSWKVDKFKLELKIYDYKLKELQELNDEIYALETVMYCVSGISYEEKPQITSPNDYKTPMLNEMELHGKLHSKKNYIEQWLKEVDNTLNKCDPIIKSMLTQIYFKERNHEAVAMEYGYHRRQMWRDIDRELEKILT